MSGRVRQLLRPGLYAYLAQRLYRFLVRLARDFANHRRLRHRLSAGAGAFVGHGVILGVEPAVGDADPARFEIGERAYIEDGVELGLTPGALLAIGRNTSIHRGCVILGNVRIGANCIFSYNIYVAAGTHFVAERPPWLIKDQDEAFLAARPRETVRIEDDVWLGWGVFVRSGVHIGRGAVIGANAVVMSDVEPYSIYAGAPARKIGQRLEFAPPAALDATKDECLPYFYSGFLDDQASLRESRARGAIRLAGAARVVLRAAAEGSVRIHGVVAEGAGEAGLRVSMSGGAPTVERLGPGPFELSVRSQAAVANAPDPYLRSFTVVELDPGQDASRIAITRVSLQEGR